MTDQNFEQNLKKYAQVLVQVGANIKEGDNLYFAVPVTDDPNIRKLAHYIVEAAYQAGAKFVDVEWRDEIVGKLRLLHANDDTLDYVAEWRVKYVEAYANAGVSRLVLGGSDPALLADVDSQRIARVRRAGQMAMQPFYPKLITENIWSVAAVATQAWADKVFAEVDSAEERMTKLWNAIFEATRVVADDPIVAWETHQQALIKRGAYMNDKQYTALHFTGDGTDLTVGLPKGHIWAGGAEKHQSGRLFSPNIPTEELFTMPHRARVNGTVKASKPLSYSGRIIDDFSFTFEDGRVVGFDAKEGKEQLASLLDTDDGAKHLGEVALVPHSSPISQTGILFFNTLFDENAACHVALGRAYTTTIEGGAEMEEDQFVESGGNVSQTHVDFMIGNASVNIDGITEAGDREPIMRQGEWAFEV